MEKMVLQCNTLIFKVVNRLLRARDGVSYAEINRKLRIINF